MPLEIIELSHVRENMLILHDDVEDDEALRTRCEIDTTLVILVLAEEQLGFLGVVETLEEKSCH